MRAARVTAYAAVLAIALSTGAAAALAGTGAIEAYPPLALAESSGMALSALHEGVVWVVEDGNFDQSLPPVVHAYEPSGAEVATVTLAGWNNRDIEAMAMGPGPTLWVADIGDNSLIRETVVVHTFPEPAELGEATLESVSYRLRYPDGPHDAESIMVDPIDGRLYVATKSIFGGGSLFVAPATLEPGATHDLERVTGVPSFVTDGAFTPDGQRMVLLVPGLSTDAVIMDAVRGDDGTVTELTEVDRLDLPSQQQPESLTVSRDGSAVLVGSEVLEGGPNEPIWAVRLPPAVGDTAPGETPVSSDPSVSASEPGAPSSVESDDCRISDPSSCLDDPIGWLAAGGVALLALMITALAVLRHSRP